MCSLCFCCNLRNAAIKQISSKHMYVMHTMDNNYIPISSVLLDYSMNNIKMYRAYITHVSRPVFSLYKRSVGITTQNVTRWCPEAWMK